MTQERSSSALDTLTADEIADRLGDPDRRDGFIRSAAQAGVAEAQALLGQMLLDGGDTSAGFGWFVRAASQHHLMALNMVGRCYDLGWGTPMDKVRAAECYRIAAGRGLPEAMYNYATLLALGDGVPEDKPAALAWLEKAAAAGFAKAANFVGSFAEDGWAGPRDMAKAARCYQAAAEGGDFRGCFNHARTLVGDGRIEDALPWLRRAGELGHDRFRAQVERWLLGSGMPDLAARGLAAVREGARC